MTNDDLQPEPDSKPVAAEAAPMGDEAQRLFPDAPSDEPVWDVTHSLMGKSLTFPVWRSLIRQEMLDQCDIKSSHRKAILRKTEKALQRTVKAGLSRLDERQMEHVHWNAFILMVDKALGKQHLKIRTDEDLCDRLIDRPQGWRHPLRPSPFSPRGRRQP